MTCSRDQQIDGIKMCESIVISLTDWLLIIQTIIIVVTLPLLIWQVVLLRRSIQGSTYQRIHDSVTDINKLWVEKPELASLWKGVEYVTSEGAKDEISRRWVITIMMDFYQNLYFQYRHGNIPTEIWRGWEKHILNVFKKSQSIRKAWEEAKTVYYKEFRDFIDAHLKSK